MSFKVVNSFWFPEIDFAEQLVAPLGAVVVNAMCRSEDELIDLARDADAVIGSASVQPFNRRVLAALSRCRILASSGVGYDQTDLKAASESGIVVTNVPDYCIDEVSGRAIAFVLALGHRLLQLDQAVKHSQVCFLLDQRALKEVAQPIFRMRDQTVGIIGLGRIGLAMALKAKGLGMRVIACDPYVFGPVMESYGLEPVDLDALLAQSDFVSLHSALTSETRGMFGCPQFRMMKASAYFINVSRGDIVDELALIRALQEGLIAGAGLDVTAQEPISADNPLLGMPNVILTGHCASYSESAHPDLWTRPMTQVATALRGEWPQYAVNGDVRQRWLDRWGICRTVAVA